MIYIYIYIIHIYIYISYIYIHTYACVWLTVDLQVLRAPQEVGIEHRAMKNSKHYPTTLLSSSFYSFECRKLKLKLDSADSGATCREQPVFQEWSLSSHTAPCEPSLLMVKSWLPSDMFSLRALVNWEGQEALLFLPHRDSTNMVTTFDNLTQLPFIVMVIMDEKQYF